MKETLEKKPELSSTISYCCNRFCPPLFIGGLSFLSMGFSSWVPWVVCGLTLFMDRNVFRVGYAVGYVDKAEGQEPNL